MISSACSSVGWSPAVQIREATSLSTSSSCSFLSSCTPVRSSPFGQFATPSSSSVIDLFLPGNCHPRRSSKRNVSNKESCSVNFNPVCGSSHEECSSPSLGGITAQYHQQNKLVELKRNAKVGGDDSEAVSWSSMATVLGATQTRRDVLTKFSSAVAIAVVNFLGNGGKETAVASVSQRVRLKDVDNQKLQDALRAAVAGDLENAETLFTEIIKEEPNSASGWSNRGSVRISLGKYEQATKDFTRAIELAPQAPVPYLNRAISYEAVGRYEEAIADCKTAIENDPEEPAAWYNLGNVEARVKDYDTSLLAYQKASILAPGIAGYRFRQALVLFQVGRLDESKKLLQGLVRKYPNYTEAHAALAALLWSEGNRSTAEEQFSEATNLEPLYSKISWVESELQWPPGVLQAFAKFLSIDYSKS
ncbi:unnamed protein product [Calypogeia fissa]